MNNTYIAEYLGTPGRYLRAVEFADRVLRRFCPWLRVASTWRGRMASVESRMNTFHLLDQVLAYGVAGDVVEIGCNSGETSVILQKLIVERDSSRVLHAFDSFQGVRGGTEEDEGVYKPGDMSASQRGFVEGFKRLGLRLPVIHPGWVEETLPQELPGKLAFALIDLDLYEPTLYALEAVYPRLSPGGICAFGIYWDPSTTCAMTKDGRYLSVGVKRACDEFFAGRPEEVSALYAGNYTMGYFRRSSPDCAG